MARKTSNVQQGAPPGKHTYDGKYGEQQMYGSSYNGNRYSRFEKDPYNEYQNFLYNRALFGLGVYHKDEVAKMHPDKKKRIIKVQRRAQTVINLWKQKIVITLTNHLFKTTFPDSPIIKELIDSFSEPDDTYINRMPLRLLKITKPDIVERFIDDGILPKNFNELVDAS